MKELTEYQIEILSRLRKHFKDLQIEIGRGDRLIINDEVITGGIVINDTRNRKDYDYDVNFIISELNHMGFNLHN